MAEGGNDFTVIPSQRNNKRHTMVLYAYAMGKNKIKTY